MPLQKPFRGLSEFLGLFQQGRNPINFNGLVGLQLDAEQFLSEPQAARSFADITTVGAAVNIVVPDTEIWLVWQISTYTLGPIATGDSLFLNAYVNWAQNTGAFMFMPQTAVSSLGPTVAGQFLSKGWAFDRGLWVPPGSTVSSRVEHKGTADTARIYVDAVYSKISI